MAKLQQVEWVGGWTDQLCNIRWLVDGLRRNGVRADWRQGPYPGDKELIVAKKDLPKTKSLLRSWGKDFVAECMTRSL